MTVVVIQTIEGTLDQYDQVNERVNAISDPPAGLIIHTASEAGDGKVRVIDVWESAAQFEQFAQERIAPAMAAVMSEGGSPPEVEVTKLHNLLKP